jgi:predicted flavoprotein YhiN
LDVKPIDIIIIGAGASGLMAAYELSKQGKGRLKEGEMFDESWEELLDEMKKLQADVSMASFLKKHINDKK